VLTLVAAFGVLVTAHVGLCVALALRRPRWRALVALFVPPLAQYFGKKEGFRATSALWVLSFSVYLVAWAVAAL
jgi:hypothetical protein